MSLQDTQDDCTNNGGYYNSQDHSCTTFAALAQICITVREIGQQWQLNDNNGCYYPFDGLGVYNKINYVETGSINFGNIPLQVRSWDDPAVYLEDLTDGHNSFDYNTDSQKRQGIDIMAAACVPLVLAIAG